MNFQTWKCKGQTYIAVDRGDLFHVIREDGENFGAWNKVEAFRKLQAAGDPNGFLGMPETAAKLSVNVFAYRRQPTEQDRLNPPTGATA